MNDQLRAVLDGRYPGYVQRFLSLAGKAVHRYGMVANGDRVLVGLSGGKDSLALLVALALRRRRVKDDYGIHAVRVEWEGMDARPDDLNALNDLAAALGATFSLERRPLPRAMKDGGLDCYVCSRERRRVLFEAARDLGCGVVALGHHLDDFALTAIMNLARAGRAEPLRPVAGFFGQYTLVRPLIMVRESSILTLVSRLGLPVLADSCPRSSLSRRQAYKPVLAELAKIDTLVRENLFRALAPTGRGGHPEDAWTSTT